jgi:hypothetical protein
VIVTSNALPTVGVEVARPTEKNPSPVPLVGAGDVVVVVVPVGAVVGPSVVVVVELEPFVPGVGVAVEVVAASATLIFGEVPDVPEEWSVTSSAVVSGSTRVRLTVAKPVVNTTLLPVVQSAWAG